MLCLHDVRARLLVIVGSVGVLAYASFARETKRGDERVLDEKMHHLGDDKTPEWTEATPEPEGTTFELEFESKMNLREWVLLVTSRNVNTDWSLEVNQQKVGSLMKSDGMVTRHYLLHTGLIRNGRNTLKITPSDPKDDMTVGKFTLIEQPFREWAKLGRVDVSVADAKDGSPLPARVTVADAAGKLVEFYYAEARTTAVRPGLAYTSNGVAALEIPAGHYFIYASRGMEWSVAKREIDVAAAVPQSVALAIEREVDTKGWIAADTHIHTLTFSGHGDSSVEERVVTLAGEGIELAVATDHNHQTDYRPQQTKLALNRWFTPVVGNEVTTDNGHMNAFPLTPNGEVPPYKETDWSKLVAGIREKGAAVVILNHPRWPEKGKDPLTAFGFDERSGERKTGQKFTFDCFELVNSDAPTQPPDRVLPCWYALLNRGERFSGVGASDSHHVGVIVGQGRTYVPSKSDDPAMIDVADACRQFKAGHVSVSLGLFATIDIAGHGMGDLVSPAGEEIEAAVRVRHPSWVKPQKLDLVVDGAIAATVSLEQQESGDGATWNDRRVRVKLPKHDAWLVAVATGAAVTEPFWRTEIPYTLAVTNPIWLDRDGDGKCTSPRALAQALLDDPEGGAPLEEKVARTLPSVDDAVGVQLLELARDALQTKDAAQVQPALERLTAASTSERPVLSNWVAGQKPAQPAH